MKREKTNLFLFNCTGIIIVQFFYSQRIHLSNVCFHYQQEIFTVCELWVKFSESAWDKHKNVMISFSSIIYDTLLDEVHTEILCMKEPTPATGTAQSTASSISDQYVYFQFGGGILASMLHN